MPTIWRLSGLLRGAADRPYAVVILNQPINANALSHIIDSATLLVCADGGANRLCNLEKEHRFKLRTPDVIIGDLDSLDDEAKNFYQEKGVEIVEDPDQYSTDFTKSLKWIRRKCEHQGIKEEVLDVIVLGGLGGRVDQGFSQIHHMYMADRDAQLLHGRIYLLSEASLTFILDEGDNEIIVEAATFEENIGVIPVMGPTRISTQGLEWDVEDWLTEFGGQLSTSNHIRSEKILLHVNGTKPLMTLELAQHLRM